jgi:hypothetical protein
MSACVTVFFIYFETLFLDAKMFFKDHYVIMKGTFYFWLCILYSEVYFV